MVRGILITSLLYAAACGDDSLSGDAGNETGPADAATDVSEDAAEDGEAADMSERDMLDAEAGVDATDAALADVSAMDMMDAGSVEPDAAFSGERPEAVRFEAPDGAFRRLPDTDEFTDFAVQRNWLQILPLRNANFPADVDYCTAGSDTALNDLQQFARAALEASVEPWLYDITLETIAESDGESAYELWVDGERIGAFSNPVTAETPGLEDMEPFRFTFEAVPIFEGAQIEVRARAHSNLTLLEGAACREWDETYAWARGRWESLTFAPRELDTR
ncbi:MAG: hypothetical protein AAF411_26115 [Myxococcota bacterium]